MSSYVSRGLSHALSGSSISCLPPLHPVRETAQPSKQDDDLDPELDPDVDSFFAGPRVSRDRPDLVLSATPALPPAGAPNFPAALSAKLSIAEAECCFEDPGADLSAKKIKTTTLQELVHLIQSPELIPSPSLNGLYDFVERTIFRDFSELSHLWLCSNDFVVLPDPAWDHFSLVYEMLYGLLRRPCQISFDFDYIKRLLPRLVIPDPKEREAIAHTITLICELHPEICQSVLRLIFMKPYFIVENDGSPVSIGPLLTVIRHCLSVSKPENSESIYLQFLLPLILSPAYHSYHREFQRVAEWAMTENPQTALLTVRMIIRRFPITNTKNGTAQLSLLRVAAAKLERLDMKQVRIRLLLLTAKCASCGHVRLEKSAFSLWNSEPIQTVLMDKPGVIIPLVTPFFLRASRDCWSANQKSTARDMVRRFARTAPDHVARIQAAEKAGGDSKLRPKLHGWAMILRTASRADHSINASKKFADIQSCVAQRSNG